MDYRIRGHRRNNVARALLLSLALHALVLSLQFGNSAFGLPWFGKPGNSINADLPALNAVLLHPEVVKKSIPQTLTQSLPGASERRAPTTVETTQSPPVLAPASVTFSVSKPVPHPAEASANKPRSDAAAAAKPFASPPPVAVLSTDLESTWRRPAGQAPPQAENPDRQEGVEPAVEAPVPELKAVDDEARSVAEKAALEAAARESQQSLATVQAAEQSRRESIESEQAAVARTKEKAFAEEQARLNEQKAAMAAAALEKERSQARLQADEAARLEAIRTEQAAAARAKEAADQALQAEALARRREAEKLAEEKTAKAVAERIFAEQQQVAAEQARVREEQNALAAAAREKELALEKVRAEVKAREESMKAEQAAAAKAREEFAQAQQAEAAARKRQAEQIATEYAARMAADKSLAESQSRNSTAATGKPEGIKEGGDGPTTVRGSELARRAIEAIRGGQPSWPGVESAEPLHPRRGSILGKDPKDIQMAFYGEGWRQKIERIGSLNYPALSKNLVYDPLVVTVSINNDGTLAGVRIVKSSGHREMDDAVVRIVTMSAPFAPFPPAMQRIYDVVDITRTWVFQEFRPVLTSD